MTNLKSVDDYNILERGVFVLWDSTNGGVNRIQFIAFTAVPNVLPFFQAVLSCSGDKLICWKLNYT